MAFAGLDQALASIMQRVGQSGQTVPGAMPSAYQTATAAKSVPMWSPATGAGTIGNAPMAGPQSVPGQTAEPGVMMKALQNPQSYGGGQQGGSLARTGMDMAMSVGMTAALTPMLGPAAPFVGPVLGQALTSLVPHKGGREQGQQQAPTMSPRQSAPVAPMQDMGAGNDQYAMLLQMLQRGA